MPGLFVALINQSKRPAGAQGRAVHTQAATGFAVEHVNGSGVNELFAKLIVKLQIKPVVPHKGRELIGDVKTNAKTARSGVKTVGMISGGTDVGMSAGMSVKTGGLTAETIGASIVNRSQG